MNIHDEPSGRTKEEYGEGYQTHSLELYALQVEMADRTSTRRQTANAFFVTLNTGLVALYSYFQLGDGTPGSAFDWLVSLAGMVVCFLWSRLIQSYRGINSAKFRVIQAMEERLPLRPYVAEWAIMKGGSDGRHVTLTRLEIGVPWIFS